MNGGVKLPETEISRQSAGDDADEPQLDDESPRVEPEKDSSMQDRFACDDTVPMPSLPEIDKESTDDAE